MENLGAMAYSWYTGFREITDRNVLELHCTLILFKWLIKQIRKKYLVTRDWSQSNSLKAVAAAVSLPEPSRELRK